MDLHLWRDIALIVLAVLGLFFLLGLAVVLYALFVFTRKAQRAAGQVLGNLSEQARKVEETTRRTARAVVEPLAQVSAFQAGAMVFFRTLFRANNPPAPASPPQNESRSSLLP
ncbi:MAG: hypothetical protein NTV14_06435 [Coprothermobacterota bacterium]|nr:hypothetical protein [Coprothermobacterota bacterium]